VVEPGGGDLGGKVDLEIASLRRARDKLFALLAMTGETRDCGMRIYISRPPGIRHVDGFSGNLKLRITDDKWYIIYSWLNIILNFLYR
jgi:hypothetical protein